ncbi:MULTISPECIES: acetate--CoA ligase [unclassified Rhodococcus (in: high G+C Gram-positive bacteria)]|uniref:acetate--CoA ligase n=1 Tax=unclassified Rhodococcus (in: high G+C Gram-positive bacteria) TaxID=192944 RepID=UPI00077A5BCC|nr:MULTISPECIES: acetate--CoA ligase [unclassified Rhodococcus (in: high G+C Gram-positive bacteria)]KXX58852.1 acetate--CoA ligase [Rhodococcus sp. LB1]PBC45523.1 acetate--CoA ligase [Rhodococcus sp. ACPA1]
MTILPASPSTSGASTNFTDYDGERTRFSWSDIERQLGPAPGGCNIAYYAVDRHDCGPQRDKVAFRFVGPSKGVGELPTTEVTFGEFAHRVRKFTDVLRGLGVGKGDPVFVFTGRIPELYVSILGALRNGSVVSPLFSAFGPEPLATRIRLGGAQVLVTTEQLYRRRVEKIRGSLPSLRHVLLVGDSGSITDVADTLDFHSMMAAADGDCDITPTSADDVALLHFTSGTTGTPKGAVHVHGAVATHYATGLYALDLHSSDVFWCTADPGWVTGTSYGVITPLLHGVTSIVDSNEFDAERWYRILEEQAVTVWYTAPTAIRMLMKSGPELAHKYSHPHLRFIASVGEPLNPDAVLWGRDVLGRPIHDNWWQTETGGIMIANTPGFAIKPGSMGRPLPGIDAAIVRRTEDGGIAPVETPNVEGELAIRRGWPSMFRGYLHNDDRYRRAFAGDWYLTGDLAKRDADGYYRFVGRADDVIKSAGHLIGPFEVENVLMEHPAVAEAGVIGKPDPIVGAVVKAFVSVKTGWNADDALRRELLGYSRKKLGASVAPKEIEFVDVLPHTRSGKIMRRLLKARELGLPEGDTSTLEVGG